MVIFSHGQKNTLRMSKNLIRKKHGIFPSTKPVLRFQYNALIRRATFRAYATFFMS